MAYKLESKSGSAEDQSSIGSPGAGRVKGIDQGPNSGYVAEPGYKTQYTVVNAKLYLLSYHQF